jgi:4-amino-4-deoxy-L-arabinose transferase-like glycosyltransferase
MAAIDLMNIDSSQYALISKEMFLNHSYLQVFCRSEDYLDKPPLLFWLSSFSINIFGIYDWAFRLPSFLVLVLGIYSLYRFAKLFYEIRVATLAALIMSTSVASYCMITDVRTDTLLTGWVMFSIWQLAEFNNASKFKNLVLASIGIGMAMLAKGPIGIVLPIIAFSCDFIYKQHWKSFFRWQYLVLIVLVALILFPMSYGLYNQFDLHPEKNVYGLQGPSGLRFYYWVQSFGRITGENYWDNNPDPFFLYHSFLWSFLPWTVFFIPAYYIEFKEKIRSFKLLDKPEVIAISGFTLVLFILSRSKYQLPHYTFLIHPFAALITAKYLAGNVFEKVTNKYFNIVRGLQYFSLTLLFIVCFLILLFVFPCPIWYALPVVLSLLICGYILFSKKIVLFHKTITVSIITVLTSYLVLSGRFYNELLKFQSDKSIANYINERDTKRTKTIEFNTSCGYAFDFYVNTPVQHIFGPISDSLLKGETFVIVEPKDLEQCLKENPDLKILKAFCDFQVTQLTPEFLNPKTRPSTIQIKYLLKY